MYCKKAKQNLKPQTLLSPDAKTASFPGSFLGPRVLAGR